MPFAVTGTAAPLANETIGGFLNRTQWARRDSKGPWAFPLPTICVVNGQPVLQREWKRRRIRAADKVEFWSRPWGKSGSGAKQIFGIIGLIALAAFAPWAGGALSGMLGLGTIGATILSGAILMGGALLINALTAPKPGGQNADDGAGSQLDSVSAQGNAAKLFQPIPVQYGRVKSFPDWAMTPYSTFQGNDQYLNVLLSVGLGEYEYEAIYIGGTLLWTPASGIQSGFVATVQFWPPNTPVTTFPTNIVSSTDVSGQSLTTTPVGGFSANPPGTKISQINVDVVFPGGVFNTNTDDGTLETLTVEVLVEVQPIDDSGAPTGDYTTLGSGVYTFATHDPQRATLSFTVASGRYQARVSRTSAPFDGGTGTDAVVWDGMRAYLIGTPSSFPVSTVAVQIKATDTLTAESSTQFGVLCTRKLAVWDAGTETFTTQASRNPFWALWDATTDSNYGINRPASKIDFQSILNQATNADARGDTFDYRFTSAMAAPAALDKILTVARSRHRWSGDVLTVVRDEWQDVPQMLLTDREIVRGSLTIEYTMNPDDAADSVILEYVDESTWAPAEVQYPPNSVSFTAVNPSRIQLDGVSKRAHAYNETAFYYLVSLYRRANVTLDTEHDGRMLGFGSRVRVQTELPQSWGSTGVVQSVTGNVLTVNPAPDWSVTGQQYFIAIRTKTGGQFGPVKCSQGDTAANIVLDPTDLAAVQSSQGMTLADALARMDGAEDPSFDFGPGTSRARDCIVITGRPSQDRVTLGLVIDNTAVHSTDLGTTPVAPSLPVLTNPPVPIISGLFANFRQGVAEPILDASWWPAAGAISYHADVSYDGGASWTPIYDGVNTTLSVTVARAALRLRVQGVGNIKGGYATADIEAPVIVVAPGTVAPSSLQPGLADYVTQQVSDALTALANLQQEIASLAADQDAANWLDKKELRTTIFAQAGSLSAEVDSVSTAAADTASALASFQTTTTASLDGLSTSVSENSTAIATVDGKFAAAWAVTLDVNNYVAGIKALDDGTTASFTISADIFAIAKAGVSGGTATPVFTVATVGGTTKLALRGDMIADGTITAQAMDVVHLTAITASFGTATVSGALTSQNGKMVIDFDNNNITFSD
jgi:hypothetical protein